MTLKVIHGPRQSGRTTKAVEYANANIGSKIPWIKATHFETAKHICKLIGDRGFVGIVGQKVPSSFMDMAKVFMIVDYTNDPTIDEIKQHLSLVGKADGVIICSSETAKLLTSLGIDIDEPLTPQRWLPNCPTVDEARKIVAAKKELKRSNQRTCVLDRVVRKMNAAWDKCEQFCEVFIDDDESEWYPEIIQFLTRKGFKPSPTVFETREASDSCLLRIDMD